MGDDPTVFVVDDDAAFRRSVTWLVRSVGLAVETFPDAASFLERVRPGLPGCLVTDLRMAGMSGLDLQDELRRRGISLPVILITGYAEVATAVRAMKAGATDFLEKPVGGQELLDRIRAALEHDAVLRAEGARRAELKRRFEELTKRERQVLEEIAAGKSNKAIAADLGVSPKTVEVHRARVMEKMGADSLAELVRAHLTLSEAPPPPPH